MWARGRNRPRSRTAREKARKRIKELSITLQQRVPGGAQRQGRRGGARDYSPDRSPVRRRSVEGFLAATPDPPRVVGKNAKCLPRLAPLVVENDPAPAARLVEPHAAVGQARAERVVRASRAGAPARPVRLTHHGRDGMWMSRSAYKRLDEGRVLAQRKLQQMRFKRLRALRKPPLSDRLAVGALMQSACGLSASKVPYMLALTARYHLGDIPPHHQFASSTALEYVRIAGFCLKQQLVARIGATASPFCIGTDTSTRGGSLGSYVVAFVADGAPVHQFFAFDRPLSSTAADLAESLHVVVRHITSAGGEFVGFSTDAPATMVGVHGGVAALMMERVGYVRHDTCEFRASARLLAIIDALWPAADERTIRVAFRVPAVGHDQRGRVLSRLGVLTTRVAAAR